MIQKGLKRVNDLAEPTSNILYLSRVKWEHGASLIESYPAVIPPLEPKSEAQAGLYLDHISIEEIVVSFVVCRRALKVRAQLNSV
jgi:hypothetical protein